MGERLIHYAAAPITGPIKARNGLHGAYKRAGFWVSVAGPYDWEWWCRSEDWNTEALAFAHEVTLKSSASILRVVGAAALDDFDREWCAIKFPDHPLIGREPDWNRLARSYAGLIIAPYVWERRLGHGFSWYYGWDCASGVIWDPAAIASVRLLTETERPAPWTDAEEEVG